MIIPIFGNPDLFYIFTVDREGRPNGLQFSIVDMTLEGGLGDIDSKNVPLYAPTSEKLAAVAHADGRSIWLVSHRWESNEFVSYLIDKDGLDPTPVISISGSVHQDGVIIRNSNALGQMKISPNGKKLALTLLSDKVIELFDFDTSTGKVSNPLSWTLPLEETFFTYGLEFSPNSKLLYVADHTLFASQQQDNQIHQFDLSLAADRIPFSGQVIGTLPALGALQLATDRRIYIAQGEASALPVINHPNRRGRGC